jgi:hypothetical protein
MANQDVIDWFLEIYDAGNEITPEVVKLLANGLRTRKRGRPSRKITHIATLALYQFCTAEKIVELLNKGDVSTIRKSIAKAKEEGWVYVTAHNFVDKKGKQTPERSWDYEGKSRQIWLDNGTETRCFTFLIEDNELKVSIVVI